MPKALRSALSAAWGLQASGARAARGMSWMGGSTRPVPWDVPSSPLRSRGITRLGRRRPQLALDALREPLAGVLRDRPRRARQLDVVDRRDRHDLAHAGGDEGLVGPPEVVER